jgi:Tol biopolymer transport system component
MVRQDYRSRHHPRRRGTLGSDGACDDVGLNGRLTSMRQDDTGFWQVWTSNPDLTAEEQLTSLNANSGWPGWSPDTSRIAFDSDRTDPDVSDTVVINDMFSMRADGGDVTKLTARCFPCRPRSRR